MNMDSDSYARIIDSLHDGLYCVDTSKTITYWNKAAERITGYAADEVVGKSCADNILTHVDLTGRSLCQDSCPLAATIVDGVNREMEIYIHHKDGHRLPVLVRVSTIKDPEGKVIGGVELFTDISSLQANSLRVIELEKLALLDNLTQLANRNYLERELQARFEEFKRHKIPFGVLFIDIDHFKKVNDTYGHLIGDNVLRFTAQTFDANSRPFDLYGRWGGEEFLGIIRNVTADHLVLLGERLRMLIEHSYIMADETKIQITISLGATLVNEHDTTETLIKRADSLMYASKQKGRNRLTLG
ncbi:MAG: sensor domain-containing diguanylate cyclase [Desulfobulbaceae bacterium]|jgi:diguanylate cyclase (GGDEF)-like protein/PAS domain S-box-containing protein|nr:sensor domain-containing diguanylate cyclase [Desulfobulbaceae bacterium]